MCRGGSARFGTAVAGCDRPGAEVRSPGEYRRAMSAGSVTAPPGARVTTCSTARGPGPGCRASRGSSLPGRSATFAD